MKYYFHFSFNLTAILSMVKFKIPWLLFLLANLAVTSDCPRLWTLVIFWMVAWRYSSDPFLDPKAHSILTTMNLTSNKFESEKKDFCLYQWLFRSNRKSILAGLFGFIWNVQSPRNDNFSMYEGITCLDYCRAIITFLCYRFACKRF